MLAPRSMSDGCPPVVGCVAPPLGLLESELLQSLLHVSSLFVLCGDGPSPTQESQLSDGLLTWVMVSAALVPLQSSDHSL